MTNAAYVAGAEVVSKLSTLAWAVVAAQQLGQHGFGAFNLALASGLFLTAVGQWGFRSVFARRASKDPSRVSQLLTETIVWQVGLGTLITLLAAAVFVITTPDHGAAAAFVIVLLATLVDMVSDTARSAATTVHRQGTTSVALAGQRLITAAAVIPAAVTWGSVLSVSVAFLLSALAGILLHWLALRRLRIHFDVRLLTVGGMRHSLSGTGRIGMSSVIQSLQYRAGFILLAVLVGEEAVGSYAAAYRLFETVLFLSFALVAAVFPLMSVAGTGAELRRLSEASVSVLLGFYVPFTVVCLVEAPRLVELVFGDQYAADSSAPLRWFAAAPLLFAVSSVSGSALVAVSQTGRLLISTTAATVTCLALSLLLIPSHGAVGAAIAFTTSLAVGTTLITVFLRRALDRPPRYLRQAVPPALCSGVVLVILILLDASFLVELCVSALVYTICWASFLRWTRSSAVDLVRAVPGNSRPTDDEPGWNEDPASPEPRDPASTPLAEESMLLDAQRKETQ